jgi:diguanylate cyclase (GGDEF)-like protein
MYSLTALSLETFETATVQSFMRIQNALLDSTECEIALEMFLETPALFAIPVIDSQNKPVGILDRHSFIEFFIKSYAKDLYGKKPISFLTNTKPITVDVTTSIEDISRIMIDAGMHHMVSGFLITLDGKYMGIANGHDLLSELSRKKQESLFYLAHIDQLTKLPNRLLFNDRLEMALLEAKRKKSVVGLLFIDLDNFKQFNDTMGHNFGDQLLISVAKRLSECAREVDTVARLSGDEFTILIEEVTKQEIIDKLCNRIIQAMKSPLEINGEFVYISASIGYVVSKPHETSSSLLLKADAAMYQAKRYGKNNFIKFKEGMQVNSTDDISYVNQLRAALINNEFELFYQPQIDLLTGKISGKEALIRWNHPEKGILTPIHFIEIAEKSGLMIEIGAWVIETAMNQQSLWLQQSDMDKTPISVNISAIQLYQPNFIAMLDNQIKKTGITAQDIELELTESMFMHDVDTAIKIMRKLKDKGFKIAIDDFGTGYSNLSYLKQFSIHSLKIDQSFIRNIHLEEVNLKIVNAIVALGKSMELDLIAEGVESESEMEVLKSAGCTYVQGYLLSKALTVPEYESWSRCS